MKAKLSIRTGRLNRACCHHRIGCVVLIRRLCLPFEQAISFRVLKAGNGMSKRYLMYYDCDITVLTVRRSVMSNTRKMASVQTIRAIEPIKNADRIEIAKILGWNVVVGKDLNLKPGDKIVYFEVDSMLPADDPRYAGFQKHGQKTAIVEDHNGDSVEKTGHVLKTIKLRGVVSQGLAMSLESVGVPEDTAIGTDVTGIAGVYKYEEPTPVGNAGIIGPFDSRLCPKSDAIRVQSLDPDVYEALKGIPATPTVKVDGTSITVSYHDGGLHVYSHNWEIDHDSQAMKTAVESGIASVIQGHEGMAVQFEMAGPGINGNRQKLARVRPFVFSVWADHVKLDRSEWPALLDELGVPVLDPSEWRLDGTVDEMISKVDGLRGHVTRDVLDEGVVWHLDAGDVPVEVSRALGDNLEVKIISNKYLLKHGL